MPDSWQFLLLFGSNAVGWALACAYMLKARKWESSYHGALRQYEGLLSAMKAPTPHQKAAETRRRKRVDEMRAHRIAMEADINRRKLMVGVDRTPGADVSNDSLWVPNLEREWGQLEQRHPAAPITLSCSLKTRP